LHIGSSSGPQLQGDSNMDQIISFIAVASGYVIAFAIGAWIGRPLLGLLTDRIFKK
jgi:membrane protein DedA with SNARE-associated domain